MFVIIRTMKIEKGYLDKVLENASKKGPIFKSPGFVKKEIFVQTKDKEFDLVKQMIYFENKKAFYVWEGSPEHIALHKDKNSDHNKKPEGIIEVKREAMELYLSQSHE